MLRMHNTAAIYAFPGLRVSGPTHCRNHSRTLAAGGYRWRIEVVVRGARFLAMLPSPVLQGHELRP